MAEAPLLSRRAASRSRCPPRPTAPSPSRTSASTLHAGEILCIVGESGSGKSMTATAIMGLLPRSVKLAGGTILLRGQDLLALSETEMRELARPPASA